MPASDDYRRKGLAGHRVALTGRRDHSAGGVASAAPPASFSAIHARILPMLRSSAAMIRRT